MICGRRVVTRDGLGLVQVDQRKAIKEPGKRPLDGGPVVGLQRLQFAEFDKHIGDAVADGDTIDRDPLPLTMPIQAGAIPVRHGRPRFLQIGQSATSMWFRGRFGPICGAKNRPPIPLNAPGLVKRVKDRRRRASLSHRRCERGPP